jgi:hypothetical protein
MTMLLSAIAVGRCHRRRGGLAAVMTVVAMSWLGHAAAEDPAAKAAAETSTAIAQMILGIVSYARWPVSSEIRRVCLAGDRTETRVVGERLTAAGGRSVTVHWMGSESEQWSESCDVAYLGYLPAARKKAMLAQMLGRPVLTIGSDDPLCAAGSMFCLDVAGDDVSLQVNLDSIARSGIRVNPKVLQLAQRKGPR